MSKPQQGDVYWIPREELADGDPNPERPHVLASVASTDGVVATLIYCSKSDADAQYHHAPYVAVEKGSGDFYRAKFEYATYVYPNRLAVDFVENLGERAGCVRDCLPNQKQELMRALGVGTGTWQTRGSASPAGLRGRIVQFTDVSRAQTKQPYGLLVTEAAYSHERSFQTIIPIDDAQEYDANDPRWVVASDESLLRLTLMRGAQSACFLVPLI